MRAASIFQTRLSLHTTPLFNLRRCCISPPNHSRISFSSAYLNTRGLAPCPVTSTTLFKEQPPGVVSLRPPPQVSAHADHNHSFSELECLSTEFSPFPSDRVCICNAEGKKRGGRGCDSIEKRPTKPKRIFAVGYCGGLRWGRGGGKMGELWDSERYWEQPRRGLRWPRK